VVSFFRESNFLKSTNLVEKSQKLFFQDNRLIFGEVEVNSYFASVAADFIRQILLRNQVSFTIETVMSHPSKVDLLRQAQNSGFRTYLYYIATDDPAINISRVRNRVIMGGHSVPEDLIVKRYYRSLDLLMDAIRYTNRAYVFDNSGQQTDHTWLAEITDGKNLELKSSLE
jgi:predicted ABC-type ATPase